MDTLLNRLYYGQINEAEQNPKIKHTGKELETYDLLCSSLNEEQIKLLDTWYKQIADRFSARIEFTFERGVKLGFHLATEINDFDL